VGIERRMAKTTERVSWLLKRDVIVGALLFFLALVPRAIGLNVFLTTDEPIWIRRTLSFFVALLERDYMGTAVHYKPGVTTLWSGVLGFVANYLLQANARPGDLADFVRAMLPAQPVSVDYLAFVRFPTVLLTSACVVGIYFFTGKLFNQRIAFLSAILLALDPYYLAHSRVIHQDALMTSFMVLSVLSFLVYLDRGRSWLYLIFSGMMAGLAFLTKSPSLFLGPYLGALALAIYLTRVRKSRVLEWQGLVLLGGELALWLLIACLLFILLWPAMWLDPLNTVAEVISKAMTRVANPYGKDNFFMGHPVSDPGLLFYPVVTLFKLTPLTLSGLLAFLGFWLKGLRGRQNRPLTSRQLYSLALVVYAASFTLIISLGADKSDRYNLPVFPALDILAAVGLYDLAGQIKSLVSRRLPSAKGWPGGSLWAMSLLLVLTLQGGSTLAHYPYYLSYFNPLLGGGSQAARTIMVGWGDGLDEAAHYLNNKESATELKAASWYYGSFAPFFVGQSWPLTKGNLYWQDVDYAVLYLNGVQRLLPNPDIVGYFRSLEPEHTVHFRGLEYAWIYKVPKPLPDVLLPIQHVQRVELGDQILLMGYDIEDEQFQSGGKLAITLYWQALRPMAEDYTVYLKLVNAVYHIWGQQEGRPFYDGMPTNAWQAGQKVKDRRELEILPGTPPGLYHIEVILHALYKDQVLGPRDGSGLLLGPIEIPRREPSALTSLDIEHPQEAILGDKVRLLGYNMESGFRPGDGIHLTLFWQCLEKMDQDYTVFTHLIDEKQNIWGQKDNQPVDGFYPTSRWEVGEIVRDQYDIAIPAAIPPSEYTIEIGMYARDTMKRLEIFGDSTGSAIQLEKVVVDW
jgi:hypothetical protein